MMKRLRLDERFLDAEVGYRFRLVLLKEEDGNPHYHDFYELYLVLSDGLRHEVNGIHQTLNRGDLLFIRKDDFHHLTDSLRREQSFLNLAFSEDILQQLFSYLSDGFNNAFLLNAEVPPQVKLDESDVEWMLKHINQLNAIDRADIAKRKCQGRIFLFRIFTRFFIDYGQNNTLPVWLREFDIAMHKVENFSQDQNHAVTLSGKTREHLCRSLQKYFNKSYSEYVNDLRLNYLANSLINSDIPVLDLYYMCGFNSPSYAYTLFKHHFGISPTKHRKKEE